HVEMLATPDTASRAKTALNLVENQEHLIFIANFPQLPQPFAAEMIIAAFALDRFDDDGSDVGPALSDESPDFRFRFFLPRDHIAFPLIFRQGKIDCRIGNSRPVEFRK